MAPIWLSWVAASQAIQVFRRQADAPSSAATSVVDYLVAQWRNPSDILSVLLLFGPEVVSSAISQLAGRAVRFGLDDEMKQERPHLAPEQGDQQGQAGKWKEQKPFDGLRITIYEVEKSSTQNPVVQGVPTLDRVWFMGIVVILIQLGIAAIPWCVNGQWDIFLVTAAGKLFAVGMVSLPQWRSEKWASPRKGGQTVAITEGNGSRSVMVVLGKRGV